MKIDANERAMEIMTLYHEGKKEESKQRELEFLEEFYASGQDHCSCKMDCSRHGNCVECILIHRAHQDHLPCCFWAMVRKRVPNPCGLCDHKRRDKEEHLK